MNSLRLLNLLKPQLLLLFCLILLARPSQVLAFQDADPVEIAKIQTMPDSVLMKELRNGQDISEHVLWLNNTVYRHEVIKRLDAIVDRRYDWWVENVTYRSYQKTQAEEKFKAISAFLEDFTALDPNQVPVGKENWKDLRDSLFFQRWDIMFTYLQVDQETVPERQVGANISWLEKHTTLQYLSTVYWRVINDEAYAYVSDQIKEQNFELIRKQVAKIEGENFVHYKSNEADQKSVKAIDLYMDNDVLVPGGFNQDREYTGGAALTFSTDLFASRWLNSGWLGKKYLDYKKPRRVVMTYQSLALGMKFYTPYIRYRDSTVLADTLFELDRPFSAYLYVERSKYRLWPKGLVRNKGTLQIGQIGVNAGRDIQALLHRDAVVESQKVYGWDKQIGHGGRWLIQGGHRWDFLLLSGTNRYGGLIGKRKSKEPKFKYWGPNLSATGEIQVGGFLTSLDGGLRLSTMDFTRVSGRNTLKPFKNNLYEFAFSADAGIMFRYVHHNSMLEGFGYRTTFIDDVYDDDAVSVYQLNQEFYDDTAKSIGDYDTRYNRTPSNRDQLNRNLTFIDVNLKLRLRKMTVFYSMNFYEKEYEARIDANGDKVDIDYNLFLPINEDQAFQDKFFKELDGFQGKDFYGYGRLGISWLL